MKITPICERVWAMPNANTFEVEPIGQLVKWHVYRSKVSIDPFARNSRICTFTNDLNPNTCAEYHMEAVEFLKMLVVRGVEADCIVIDPPYSPHQITEVYQQIGLKASQEDTQNARLLANCREEVNKLTMPGSVVIFCGWNSAGMGLRYDFELERVLLVCHGGGHNDTIVTVERKREPHNKALFQ
jgi:hypothetical protein